MSEAKQETPKWWRTIVNGKPTDTNAVVFGTMEWVDGSVPPASLQEVVQQSVLDALNHGFKSLDCAELYESTVPAVGKAVQNYIAAGGHGTRDDVFVVSKIKGLPCGDYADVKKRVVAHLNDLGLQHLDLLLIHWPGPSDIDFGSPPDALEPRCSLDWFKENIQSAWENLQKLVEEKIVNYIGVSNFYKHHIDEMLKRGYKPFANEIFVDVCHQQTDFVSFLQSQGILVLAYRPLAFLSVIDMVKEMGDPTFQTLTDISGEIGASTIHEVVLAWLSSRGIVPISKTKDKERAKRNAESVKLSGKLTPAHLQKIAELEGSMMVVECGGTDEYARMFQRIGTA
jgi:diketogulonate reductase-like aldo/keto reductase